MFGSEATESPGGGASVGVLGPGLLRGLAPPARPAPPGSGEDTILPAFLCSPCTVLHPVEGNRG